MWVVDNTTPFEAQGAFARDHNAATFWVVWVKATFELRADRPAMFTPDQAPIVIAAEFADDDAQSALLADSDNVLPKQKIDLLLLGHVLQAAADVPKPLTARLGDWSKALWLHPPQRWNWRGQPVHDLEAKPQRIALDGRAGFGGPKHEANPVGRGHQPKGEDPIEDAPVLLTYADEYPGANKRARRPASFAPVARHWPERQRLSGTYDEKWEARRAPLLPKDFDPAFWQAAPADQQLERSAVKDAVLELSGFDGVKGARYPLPGLDLTISTQIKGTWKPVTPELQTIAVDVDKGLVSLTYAAKWQIARAGDDVAVAGSKVWLNSTDAFRVAPEQAGLFHGQDVVEETA